MLFSRLALGAIMTVGGLTGCSDDDVVGVPDPEITRFAVQIENVARAYDFIASGVFNTPDGATAPGPVTPGSAYSFRFHAAPGHTLSFATMFVQSNDLFYAPDGAGIALFDGAGDPRSGDVTDEVQLWDAGTEIDQEPGLGADQAPRQAGADTGADDPNTAVRLAEDGFGNLPAVTDAIRATLTHLGEGEFMFRIESLGAVMIPNSGGGSTPVVLAPGVFTVGGGMDALFTVGAADRGEGLEAIAEDGDPSALYAVIDARTGITSPLAPGAWAVHASGEPIFSNGAADRGEGLEALAEDGDPSALANALANAADVASSGAFNTPDGAGAPGPLFPGSSYSFEIEAVAGDYLSLATMFVQSNDLFYAPGPRGLRLFNGDVPRSGDITEEFLLWDAGTEANQGPGSGPDQAPRQAGADTGADESGVVTVVNDAFVYPAVDRVIRVTLTPLM